MRSGIARISHNAPCLPAARTPRNPRPGAGRHAAGDWRYDGCMDEFMRAAIDEARRGLAEGGIPVGSVLVLDGAIVGRGHNRRMQRGSAILHGEMDALENAGRRPACEYRRAVLYTTLSPCDMCSGAILLYRIPRVVIGENRTFMGAEALLRQRGVRVEYAPAAEAECQALMQEFIRRSPKVWNEDIGV